MKKILVATLAICLFAISCNVLKKGGDKKEKDSKPEEKPAGTNPLVTMPSGLKYQIVRHGTNTRKPVLNDKIEVYLTVHVLNNDKDSLIFDFRKVNNDKPVPVQIVKPKYQGDPIDGYMQLTVGDSANFYVPVDTLLKSATSETPVWMKHGATLKYDVALISIKSDSEARRETQEKFIAQRKEDDSLLQDYFARKNLTPKKSESGLYYIIKKEGTGNLPRKGESMSVYYTGKFLNGNIFDTNQDSTFHHQEPFNVEIGKGRVIKGWLEGLAMLKKGSEATLFIPSHLGYGPKGKGVITANAILIFDVQIADIRTQEQLDDKIFNDFFKEQNLSPTKTESGLYYTISKKGKGPNAKAGQIVSVKYTGKTLDGKAFDSNIDTIFHHTDPLTFELGKGIVIKGWEEGLTLLNKGAKATLYIPSTMAYGPKGQDRKIPPNALLIFDVEMVNIKNADKEQEIR